MVVHNLNVMRIAVAPRETDAPPVVDSNAVEARAVALQQFKLVSRRRAKILQPPCLMQVQKLPPRRALDGLKSPDHAVCEERSGVRALERPDQTPVYDVSGIMSNVIDGEPGAVERPAVRVNRQATPPSGAGCYPAGGGTPPAPDRRSRLAGW